MKKTEDKIKVPYCIIDGVRYQLYVNKVDGVLRFPDDGRAMPDLNKLVIDYAEKRIPLSTLFEYDINSGSSYERVYGIYSRNGMNNHIVTQGPEQTKRFRLYLGNTLKK